MDRTAATQLLVHLMRAALSGIFDVADPTRTVTLDLSNWVSGWHTPLLKPTKAAIHANRDDTHDLHSLLGAVCPATGKDCFGGKRPCHVQDSFDRLRGLL